MFGFFKSLPKESIVNDMIESFGRFSEEWELDNFEESFINKSTGVAVSSTKKQFGLFDVEEYKRYPSKTMRDMNWVEFDNFEYGFLKNSITILKGKIEKRHWANIEFERLRIITEGKEERDEVCAEARLRLSKYKIL